MNQVWVGGIRVRRRLFIQVRTVKMKIYLFRHGETDWNKERRLQGQSDIPLNAFGRELAVKTAEELREVPFGYAFSSPLGRALETAKIIMGIREIPLVADERLMEMHFGEYEGSAFDAPKKDPSHPLYRFFCKPEAYVPPVGAESFQDVMARGSSFLQDRILPLEGVCENVLVVAHGAFNRSVLCVLGGCSLENFWGIGLPNCAASILSLENGCLRIAEESRIYYENPVNARP